MMPTELDDRELEQMGAIAAYLPMAYLPIEP